MLQLVLNEFRHVRVMMFAILGAVAVVAPVCAWASEPDLIGGLRMLILIVPAYLGLTLAANSFRAEGRGNTWRLLQALPASPATIVTARFLGALATMTAGTLIGVTGLMVADGHLSLSHAALSMSLPLLLGLLLLGLNYWLCFCVGERSASIGLIAILVVLQVIGAVQLALAPRGGGLTAVIQGIENWLSWAAGPAGLFVCSLVAFSLLIASWGASIAAYARRDLTRAM